jgi:pyruvyltransferase
MAGYENVISPYLPWARVIEGIVGADLVISSSLHGLIVADAFDIPCIYLRLSEAEGMFKYEDYALGAGRSGISVVRSREAAVRASPLPPPNPDLERLTASFPWDLWE